MSQQTSNRFLNFMMKQSCWPAQLAGSGSFRKGDFVERVLETQGRPADVLIGSDGGITFVYRRGTDNTYVEMDGNGFVSNVLAVVGDSILVRYDG